MLKKLLEGFVFGVGFALALVLVVVGITPRLMPISFGPSEGVGVGAGHRAAARDVFQETHNFHELPVEDKIRQASVIALARYEPAPDGKMKAVVREFMKQAPDTEIPYRIGDEYPPSSYYPSPDRGYGEGVIVFFVGSPASMRLAVTFEDERIRGLADIPVELFRQKCRASGA